MSKLIAPVETIYREMVAGPKPSMMGMPGTGGACPERVIGRR